jgi:hypothetical protein
LDERDWMKNVTVLSGERGAPDELVDNSRNVVTGAEGARLDGLTITRGYARGATGGAYHGAGLVVWDAAMEVAHCAFVDNHTADGSELGGDMGESGGCGGAISTTGSLVVEDCTFVDNSTGAGAWNFIQGGQGGDGGAICTNDSLFVYGSSFIGNTAGPGGDADNFGSRGGSGGAIYALGLYLTIHDSTFYDNTTGEGGTGTLTGADGGGGGAVVGLVSDLSVVGNHSVLWGNIATTSPELFADPGMGGPFTSLELHYNDVQGGCVEAMDQAVDCGEGNLDVDPGFVDAAAGNLRLMAASPLRDQGESLFMPLDELDLDGEGNEFDETWSQDLDGNPRPVGAEVDPGAYELQ